MSIRVSSVEFVEGGVAVNWFRDEEQGEHHREYHQSVITYDAAEKYEQVNYYMSELWQDVHELVEWWTRRDRQ